MYQYNKINFAVKIETGSTISIPELGLVDGVFKLTTGGYDPELEGAVYEDGSLVESGWRGDVLSLEGVSPASQSIDLIEGGDYAFLGTLKIFIANAGGTHVELLRTEGLSPLGGKIQLFVIYDNKFYSRWCGSVAEYDFDEKAVEFIGRDAHNTFNKTTDSEAFGLSVVEFKKVNAETLYVVRDQTVKSNGIDGRDGFGLVNNNYRNFDTSNTIPIGTAILSYGDESDRLFNGVAHYADFEVIASTTGEFIFNMNGRFPQVQSGMFLKFKSGSKYYLIKNSRIRFGTGQETGEDIYYTEVTLDELPEEVIDFTQYYGEQNFGSFSDTADIIEATGKFFPDTEKLFFDIFEKVLTFKKPAGSEWLKRGGKYVAVDDDGVEVLVEAVEDADGDLTVQSTDLFEYFFSKNNSIKYAPLSDAEFNAITNGTARNIQDYAWRTVNIENNLEPDGKYWKSDFAKAHAIQATLPEGEEEVTPFMLISNLIWAREVWSDRLNEGINLWREWYPKYFGSLYNGTAVDSRTDLSGGILSNDEESVYNRAFSRYEVTVYRIFTCDRRGDVPVLDSSFELPNYTHFFNKSRDPQDIFPDIDPDTGRTELKTVFDVRGVATTNLPIKALSDLESETGLRLAMSSRDCIQWRKVFTKFFPDGRIETAQASELKPTERYMFVVTPAFVDGVGENSRLTVEFEGALSASGTALNGSVNIPLTSQKFSFGINSVGFYQYSEVQSVEDLNFKTVDESSDTLDELVKKLAPETTSPLDLRSSWYVGGQIEGQRDTFDLITQICKQSFLAGYTDRFGVVQFKEFLERVSDTPPLHSENIYIRGSLGKFRLSSVSKLYNELSIKFHKQLGEYLREVGVSNVSEEAFPPPYTTDYAVHPYFSGDSNTAMLIGTSVTNLVKMEWYDPNITPEDLPARGTLFRFTDTDGNDVTGQYYNFESINYTIGGKVIVNLLYDNPLGAGYFSNVVLSDFETLQKTETDFSDFVQGVSSYADAKSIWERARASYILNKRIRKAPATRTDLEFAIDRNLFFNTSQFSESSGYGIEYFRLFLYWCTTQKVFVDYKLPINEDTLVLEIAQDIHFRDKLITGSEVWKGWITDVRLLKDERRMKVEVMFDPESVMNVPDSCGIILETASSPELKETASAIIEIVEGKCGQ